MTPSKRRKSQITSTPPGPPWKELEGEAAEDGFLSYYLADDLGRFPVRGITRVGDNKSDPNLETLTYGLFSTCEASMRQSIAKRGIRDLFFLSRPRGATERALVGHYRLRWFCEGPLAATRSDFSLAAESGRFIDPIPVSQIPGALGELVAHNFRLFMKVDAKASRSLRKLIYSKPDRTDRYLEEVKRLEQLNASYTGYRYPTWKREQGWSWGDAATYLKSTSGSATEGSKNTSPSGRWFCTQCRKQTTNTALLKACPHCGQIGTLKPLATKS